MGNTVVICLLIYIFIFFNTKWCCCNENSPNNSTVRCKPSERAALLNFKHNLTYFDKDVLSSWEGQECCNWGRVVCDNTTGHILELDLYGNDTNHLIKMEKLESLVYLLELRQLERLNLRLNDFNYCSIPIFMGSMKQLRYLDLSSALIGGLIPCELGNLTNLLVLDLRYNKLSGEIPVSLGKLSNLKELYLSYNNLSFIAPPSFPSNLEFLYLSGNQLSGKILKLIMGKLFKLREFGINYNPLKGTILSEHHFANLSSLTNLYMSGTMLTLNLSSDWVPPFQLQEFYARSCEINGQFPPWLQTQKNLSFLDLSNTNITGLMPRWFHKMQQLNWIELSNNSLSGSPIFPINFSEINLYYNNLSWDILSNESKTVVYRKAFKIHLSNNFITGPFPEGLVQLMPNLGALFLSNNQISGPIPNSLCQLTSLNWMGIKNNSLSGVIPNCLTNISTLTIVQLSNNKLKGHIPCFNNSDAYKFYFPGEFHLHLNDNMLIGEIPSCLSTLTNLKVLDIGGNQLSGKMNQWFKADKFKQLNILRLRGNKFSGTIPRQLCSCSKLQILDLAHNHFSGSIPLCISNFTGMTLPTSPDTTGVLRLNEVREVFQGIQYGYTTTLPYLVDIDLSCNNLAGSIPDDVTKLSGLLSLNLSYNKLSGVIPENIGGLKSLIALDLSKNKLRGSIPTSIGELNSLSRLDLSYNNLSGQIPTGNQLQTLSDQASIYAGNPYLCGDFLPRKCKSKADKLGKGRSFKDNGDKEKKLKKMGFDLVVMSGFATGFWGVVGCLVLNRRRRHAFFRRLEDYYNWLYVIVVLKVRVLKAKIKRGE